MKSQPKPKAPDLVVEICTQVIPCQKLTPENFWRLCAEYPRREAASVYLYRLWPIIDRRLAGMRYKNIDKWVVDDKPINEERILGLHGSGRYRITFNDANRPRPLKQVAETVVTIDRSDRPPVIPIEELVREHPDNRSYVQGLRAAGELKDESMNAEGKAVEQLAAMSRQLLAERAGKRDELLALKLVELLKPKKDPVELAMELQKLSEGRKDDVLLKALLDGEIRLTAALLKERGGRQGGELEAIDKILSIAGKLGLAPRNARSGTDWGAAVQGSLDRLAAIVLGLPAVIRELRRGAGAGRAPAGEAVLPRELPILVQPVQPQASAGTAEPAAAQPDEGEGQEDSDVPTLEALAIVGRRAIEAYQAGKSGAEFGAALKLVEPQLYQQLQTMGKGGIMAALSMEPGIWDQIGSERAGVEAWLDSFFA